MRFILAILVITFHFSFLNAKDSSFKFTFGSNLGNIPLKINKMSKNIKPLSGIKINSWILSPNFLNFSENEKSKEKESLYIKFNFKF